MKLIAWYRSNGRHTLPWRANRDPYRILVSEFMLQQTQVARVVPKYGEFMRLFPTIEALARAERTRVLRAWQGLGYNSRAARLHAIAKLVVAEHAGELPRTYDELLALPGVGPYTAGAVMAFAHGHAVPMVDVNVERVLRRLHYTRRQRPRDVGRLARRLAEQSGDPHAFYSAIMDFGSAVCTARNPACEECPLYGECKSRGVRPDERPKSRPRYEGSSRWWRGQVMRILLERPMTGQRLLKAIRAKPSAQDKETYGKALSGLLEEGLIRREKGLLKA